VAIESFAKIANLVEWENFKKITHSHKDKKIAKITN